MNNDLISREALKNYAREVLCGENATNISLLKMFDEIIDNAPTVKENWKFYYDHGYKQAERDLKRPQATNNAELFKQTFGIYATELWTMPNAKFMEWLNADVRGEDHEKS